MRNTWHFTIPETLLLPSTDRLAVQQGLFTLATPTLQNLLTFFEIFSAYANLPLGLNPKHRQELREQLNELKKNKAGFREIAQLVKYITAIKNRYQESKQEASDQQLPIFVTYEVEDLLFIADKVLRTIGNYIKHSKKELEHCKRPTQSDHPINIFSQFITTTDKRLQIHQQAIAKSMLLRLQESDKQCDISNLSRDDFIAFHHYIEKHGNLEIQSYLKKCSWAPIIKPIQPRWPRWLFRGSDVLYRAFGNMHQQATLALKIKQLNTIDPTDASQLTNMKAMHQMLANEAQRLTKLKKKLFPWIHNKEKKQLNQELARLHPMLKKASRLQQLMQQKRVIMPADTQQLRIISSRPAKTIHPEQLHQELTQTLHQLIHQKTNDPAYLEKFGQIKEDAEKLPFTKEYLAIKRLCTAGPNIPHIINELINAILALAGGECQTIALLNPLLLDIIKADLIAPNKKTLLQQLIDATLFDPKNTVPVAEKQCLLAVKNALNGNFTTPSTSNPYRLTYQPNLTETKQGNDNGTTLRHF